MERRSILPGLVLSFLLPSFLLPCLASTASAAALFTGPFDTPVARNPQGLTAGDVDGDGDLDLVVCHYTTESLVTVLLNDGSGQFHQAPGSPIVGIPFPVSSVLASFNPAIDSFPDLVVVGGTGFYSNGYFLLGDGTGRFNLVTSFFVGETAEVGRQAAAPDFNVDFPVGIADIVFTSGQVRLGSGSTLVRWTDLPMIPPVTEVTTGDFDGDGHPDAAFVSYTHGVQVYLSYFETGLFVEAPGSPVMFGTGPENLVAADLDGDGDLDLVVTDIWLMGVHLLLNQGGGRFVHSGFAPVSASYPRGIATADFDGDGHPDVAVGSNNSASLSVLLGDGSGGLHEADESPLQLSVGVPVSIIAGDLNGDSLADLAAVDFQGSRIAVFLHAPPPVRDISIDILPGSADNTIRLGSQGVLPVAILTTDDFDATTVDPSTVRLAGAPVQVNSSGAYACQPEDVDRDHRPDLLCKVDKPALQLHVGDTVAVLEASTFDGETLRGQDAVRVLEGKAPHLPGTTRWPGTVIPVP